MMRFYNSPASQEMALANAHRYAGEKQEIDKLLERVAAPVLEGRRLTVLDACCGGGHVVKLLSELSPGSTFLGVDLEDFLIGQARELNPGASFEAGDVLDLPERYPKAFDVTVSWKTLSWMPHYGPMLDALLAVTRGHIFISSLFWDGELDFFTQVEGWHYNTYSLPRFARYALERGAKNIKTYHFEIGVDLPRPSPDTLGTYTRRLEDGSRLQFTGALALHWKVLRLDL